ncbi:protein of unknown function [Taphrina deformans PYCC 5710]|uniref:GDP/GTP exchange factor Sec2 N-terminal domain-containing protein n=1 Tax=Taphrina deformans (strain PYCC 5710 / ATCC 11124 / CBS 356.35 / IMI 108563 / JCM 9778 / NBRC 8474) TaxID=1097556 RepID=R4X8U8_TAPDE|nr:protein of unknown function [Taphrina deformans PYCC 5710]|eukprot:CCG82069.1 protein of unknown function [Taphrina deformans PYCC 5710]
MSDVPTTALEKLQHEEILELESQIRSLNTKISAAVDHAADLQDEIRTMRARQREENEARESLANESSLRRMSTYFSGRRPSVATTTTAAARSNSMSPSRRLNRSEDEDLVAQLQRERVQRLECESKYRALQDESEALSESLFEEANKMVAVERQLTHNATIKLQAMKNRESESRRRLEDLERAMERIGRYMSQHASPKSLI